MPWEKKCYNCTCSRISVPHKYCWKCRSDNVTATMTVTRSTVLKVLKTLDLPVQVDASSNASVEGATIELMAADSSCVARCFWFVLVRLICGCCAAVPAH